MTLLPQLACILQSQALMELFGQHITFESSRAEKGEVTIEGAEVRTRASSQPTALEGATRTHSSRAALQSSRINTCATCGLPVA